MDLGRSSTTLGGADGRSTAELLDDLSSQVMVQRQVEVDQFETVIAWADANTVESLEGAATIRDSYVDTGLPLAGQGAPLVSEFALLELCATLERSVDSGRAYVGKVVECGWRLPRIRDAVYAGTVPVWKALRVAELTRMLSVDAAAYVDRNLAFALPRCTWAQVERLVQEAIDRFDPDAAEERRQDAADHRRVDIDLDHPVDGTVNISGTLDTADAADLDTALTRRAKVLGQFGCEETLEVRRAIALGEMARADHELDLKATDPDTGETVRVAPGRKVELHLHLVHSALTGITGIAQGHSESGTESTVGRMGTQPVTAEQIRQWCALEGGTILVRPVVDLQDCVPVDSYEIPDRLRTRVELRDHTCRAPHCTRKAKRCDLDHAVPYGRGGPTCPCNLVPLCRQHHRAKTLGYWAYTVLEPGRYLWMGATGRLWLVDHTGTRAIDPPKSLDPQPDLPEWVDPGWTEPEP